MLLLLWAKCSTCQALEPGNYFDINPLPGCTAIESFQDCTHMPTHYPPFMCRGVICLVEVVDGSLQTGDKVASLASGETYDVSDVSSACSACWL